MGEMVDFVTKSDEEGAGFSEGEPETDSSDEGSSVESETEEELIASDDESDTDEQQIDIQPPLARDDVNGPAWVANQPEITELRFTGITGVHESIQADASPLAIFETFVTDELVDSIVEQTNLFAEQYCETHILKPRSRVRKWRPVNRNDIRLYIAFALYRGIVWKPTYAMYFSTDPLFDTPILRKVMSYDRFCMVDKFIHFVDNTTLPEHCTKKAKIEPIYDYLVNKFKTLYLPKRDISIDESLLLWKGRLSWKQYIANKRSRFGIKSFALCESETGYIWNCFLYTGDDIGKGLPPGLSQSEHRC